MKGASTFGLHSIWGKRLLVVILLAGMTIAGYLAFNVWNRIHGLDSAQQDHAEWVFSQLEIEFLKLDRALDQGRGGSPEELDDLRKRFDIFYSRVVLAEKVRNNTVARPAIERLRQLLDENTALIDGGDAALVEGLDALQTALREVEGVPREIALQSIALAAEASQAERQNIVRLIEVMAIVVLIVTLALLGAILRLTSQTNRLNKTSRLAEENELRLATTLRASLDAIIVIDDHATIKDFNGSAEQIFGIPRDGAMGKDYVDLLIPPSRREQQRKNLETFRSTGQTVLAEAGRREFEMIDHSGRVFPVELSVSLTPSAEGPVFVIYIRDITDKLQREAEILQARDEALEAYREKSRFFAMMSHEMRTPLNGVVSALQLLQDGKLDEEQRGYLDAAITSGDILLGHINDVLAIERSEAGSDERMMQHCDITSLTSGLIGTMEPFAKSMGAHLHLDQGGLTDLPISTDPRAIQQILVNLLTNAIKFSPEGEVTLRAWFSNRREGEGDMELYFEVVDDGPGIPEADMEKIFEDFVSLDRRYERRTGGTGLGLGIVRRLVHGLGGEISCHSVLGEGARFTVRLPVTPAEAEDTPELPVPTIERAKKAGLCLLVVDDNDINRNLLSAMLKRMGHEVTLAAGGKEAIEEASRQAFDAILMDISMPEINGIQATRAILTGDGPNRATPIIPVTAHALPEERLEFKAAGMTGFLQKPIDLTILRSTLDGLTAASDTTVASSAEPSDGGRGQPWRPLLNEIQVTELIELLGRDNLAERITALVERVEQDLPELVEAKAVADLQTRSHALAGMCGMFGADRLHGMLSDIETACKSGNTSEARSLAETLPAAWAQTRSAWRQRLPL